MEERGGMGEEEEWLEWVEWRRGQRGGTAGAEKCLNGRTWRKAKRRNGWSGEWDNGWNGGVVKEEEYVGTGETSTQMMIGLTNS